MFDFHPTLPQYPGPYTVGSLDAEIPVSELPPHPLRPENTECTISFRIFYPCQNLASRPESIHWLPDPQREYLGAYTRFVGASRRVSSILRYLPIINASLYTTIPVLRHAPMLQPNTSAKRWPVMIFSHGLGGTRNSYSQICGSLASHGMVVVAPEHRDGSAPVSIVHTADKSARHVEYRSIPHRPGQDVEDGRNAQFRIRLWELGLLHELLLKLDHGHPFTNVSHEQQHAADAENDLDLSMFASSLDVHRPGRISWSGHSFGGATMVQLLKSTFYHASSPATSKSYIPLYVPSPSMMQQITPASHISLLDLWAMPFDTAVTRWLFQKPLPGYSDSSIGGSNVLLIASEGFYKWRGNLIQAKRIISPDPSRETPSLPVGTKGPHIYYPETSAHLSQSDFGVLYPWITKRALGCQEPERTIVLNVRAILEMMRRSGIEVAETSSAVKEVTDVSSGAHGDPDILMTNGQVRGWIALSLDVDGPVKEVVARDERTGPENAVIG